MANARFTLRLDDELVRRAKRIAEHRGISLSKLVEHCLTALADVPDARATSPALPTPLSPLAGRFAGRVRPQNIEQPQSPEDDRRIWVGHLEEKNAG